MTPPACATTPPTPVTQASPGTPIDPIPGVDDLLPFADEALGLARRMSASAADTEDALQQAYLQVLAFRGQRPHGALARLWFLRVVANAARQIRRRGWVRLRRHGVPACEPVVSSAGLPGLEHAELRLAIAQALGRLDEKYRLAVSLRYELGLSYEEVAAVLAAPVARARLHVSRGLARLRVLLERQGVTAQGLSRIGWFGGAGMRAADDTPGAGHHPLRPRPPGASLPEPWLVPVWPGRALAAGGIVLTLTVGLLLLVFAMAEHPPVVADAAVPAAAGDAVAADPLAARVRVRLRHANLPEAMDALNAVLPPGAQLRYACPPILIPRTFLDGWQGPYYPWTGVSLGGAQAQPVRAVLDGIAAQLQVDWRLIQGVVVFSRPASAAELAAFDALPADALSAYRTPGSQAIAVIGRITSSYAMARAVLARVPAPPLAPMVLAECCMVADPGGRVPWAAVLQDRIPAPAPAALHPLTRASAGVALAPAEQLAHHDAPAQAAAMALADAATTPLAMRLAIIGACSDLRNPPLVAWLCRHARQDSLIAVRALAFSRLPSLASQPDPATTALLERTLRHGLDDPAAQVRSEALRALGAVWYDPAFAQATGPRVLALTADAHPVVRANALVALDQPPKALLGPSQGLFCQRLGADPDARVRLRAAQLMTPLLPANYHALVLAAQLDPDPTVVAAACHTLAGVLVVDAPPHAGDHRDEVRALFASLAAQQPPQAVAHELAASGQNDAALPRMTPETLLMLHNMCDVAWTPFDDRAPAAVPPLPVQGAN